MTLKVNLWQNIALSHPLMPNKVEKLYEETLSFEEALQNTFNRVKSCNWHQILRQFIRYAILDTLINHQSNDQIENLKHFVLLNHHDNGELSQRDIQDKLREMMAQYDEKEKAQFIREGIDRTARALKKVAVEDTRREIALVWDQKQKLFDGAVGDEPYDFFLKRLKSFNYRSIRDFATAFNVRLRRKNERHDGASYKNQQSANRTRFNGEMWNDPKKRKKVEKGLKRGWVKRRNNNKP